MLEVNDEMGLGPSANIILVDGTLRKGDTIVVLGKQRALSRQNQGTSTSKTIG